MFLTVTCLAYLFHTCSRPFYTFYTFPSVFQDFDIFQGLDGSEIETSELQATGHLAGFLAGWLSCWLTGLLATCRLTSPNFDFRTTQTLEIVKMLKNVCKSIKRIKKNPEKVWTKCKNHVTVNQKSRINDFASLEQALTVRKSSKMKRRAASGQPARQRRQPASLAASQAACQLHFGRF